MGMISDFLLNVRYAFRPHKPLLFARLVHAVFRSYLLKSYPLRYVDFSIDFACNLKCNHCFAEALKNPGRRRMTPGDYRRVARECMRLGAVNFSFQGGEPLLFPHLDKVISSISPQMNVVSVTTNGTLLNESNIRRLKALGVDILTVSLDSGIPEEHDRFRGLSGSFEKTWKGMELALQLGLRVTVGTVITSQNLHGEGLRRLLEKTREIGVITYLIFPVLAGRWKDQEQILLTEPDLAYVADLCRGSPFIRTDFQANFGPYGCGAAKEILYLTPYGDVLTCPFIHISPGNIFEESVQEIRERAMKTKPFGEYHHACLASTDAAFFRKYLKKTFSGKQLPLPWQDVFCE